MTARAVRFKIGGTAIAPCFNQPWFYVKITIIEHPPVMFFFQCCPPHLGHTTSYGFECHSPGPRSMPPSSWPLRSRPRAAPGSCESCCYLQLHSEILIAMPPWGREPDNACPPSRRFSMAGRAHMPASGHACSATSEAMPHEGQVVIYGTWSESGSE